jgi:hypothetical protein
MATYLHKHSLLSLGTPRRSPPSISTRSVRVHFRLGTDGPPFGTSVDAKAEVEDDGNEMFGRERRPELVTWVGSSGCLSVAVLDMTEAIMVAQVNYWLKMDDKGK